MIRSTSPGGSLLPRARGLPPTRSLPPQRSFVAPSAIFVGSLLSDLFTMVMLPIPVLGTVLLYFDVRRKRDNFTNDNLRTDLDALKGA